MLSIAKLAPGSEGYYLDAVAWGAEDYYVGRGEAPGYWTGRGAELLGLDGEVSPEALQAVLAGHAPDGSAIGATNRKVPGFDFTFSVPKSVSVLAALRPELSERIVDAGEVAVARTLAWIEDHACGTRLGHDGVKVVDGDGFVAAAFRHRTSRAGDPQLHWHVLVANATRAPDRAWRALDGSRLYPALRTAGFLFEAQLRHELSHTLGVRWGSVSKGIADIDGVPAGLQRLFAKRRDRIVEQLAIVGYTSPKAAQAAAYATRDRKAPTEADPTLWDRWCTEAAAAGFTRADLDGVTGHDVVVADAHTAVPALLAPGGLTRRSSTFTSFDALRGVCEAMPAGCTIDEAEHTVDELLGRAEVVRLGSSTCARSDALRLADGRVIGIAGMVRYSTQELLTKERRIVDLAIILRADGRPHVSRDLAVAALDRYPTLSDEQRQAVGTLVTRHGIVDVLVAPAGSGKTFCLSVARAAWEDGGYRVMGASLAARAAQELQDQASIPSGTVERLLLDLASRVEQLDHRTVLVVDEAAMVGTRDLHPILEAAHRGGGRIVLVGDPRQLQAIDAGGVLRGLEGRLPTIALTENRRQEERWERRALVELRSGDVGQFLDAYWAHGRIHDFADLDEVRRHLVADWFAATAATPDTVMLAIRRSDVDELNRLARASLAERGLLGPSVLDIDGRQFAIGDRVVLLQNRRTLGLLNGMRGTVLAVDTESASLRLGLTSGEEVSVPHRYLAAGHVGHGYAITIHKAQGLTVDQAFVLGGDDLHREAGYTALSRARTSTHLYLTMAALYEGRPEQSHGRTPADTTDRILERWLRISRAEHLGIDRGIELGW